MTGNIYSAFAAVLTAIGLLQAIAGGVLAMRFVASRRHPASPVSSPITILKPLHGDEPLLQRALASVCAQDYPRFQVVFGVQDPGDPALRVVESIRSRFPEIDIALVVNPAQHGTNRKVSNLINMLPAAKHNVLVIADSDLHVQTDYLRRLAEALNQSGTGLATTLYAGLPASKAIPAQLGSMQITHSFLPGALLARAIGRQDCLGATMAIRRETLAEIGGLETLVNHLADDNVLGRRVQALGLSVGLASTVPATTVPETTFAALARHELRWARTIRALVPGSFAASALQYPLSWALTAVLLSGGAVWPAALFLLAWGVRATAAIWIDRALGPMLQEVAFHCPVWLLPLRDLLSVAIMVTSYAGRRVDWRGHTLHADSPIPFRPPKG
ncbi:MAG: bacteriohopanetetrol glucosamine biosynthesis glycosyltransferase HpnI [Acetobacteraceae bacterium]|nr:bacteriohopanetetrol glucosamine biosynthesis glycosyltransferase HpnI [Acetobacteraceae bacterium]